MTGMKNNTQKHIRRFLALLLACTMIFQQCYMVFASESDVDPQVISAQAEADTAVQAAAEAEAARQAEAQAADEAVRQAEEA